MASFRGYTITQDFGVRNKDYRLGYHPGLDLAFKLGEYQPAFASGVARFYPDKGDGYGNTGTITLGNGDVLFYAHLAKAGMVVPHGSLVGDGQNVFITGNTGWVEGIHGHIEYRPGGDADHPVDITKQSNAKGDMLMIDRNLLFNYYRYLLGRPPEEAAYKAWVGKPADVVFQNIVNSPEFVEIEKAKIDRINHLLNQERILSKHVTDRDIRIRQLEEQKQSGFVEVKDKLYKKES